MPPSPPETPRILGSSGIKRHRRTTACTTCRERRVKCSRERPFCAQCKRGGRSCKYVNSEIPEYKFVEVTVQRNSVSKSPSPEIWSPIFERKSAFKAEAIGRSECGVSQISFYQSSKTIPPNFIHYQFHQPVKQAAKTLGARGEDFIFFIHSKLPAREICDHFLDSFLTGIQAAVPICYIDDLMNDYSDFWTISSLDNSPESRLLILAVLYCGAASSTINISQSATLHDLYEQLLNTLNLPKYKIVRRSSAIKLLQAYLLVNTFQISTKPSSLAYEFLHPAIRLAQSLYLQFYQPRQSEGCQTEVEKRIWWHVLFLDLQSTLATGSPLLIPAGGYTTEIPLRLGDNDNYGFSHSQKQISPMMIAFQGQCQWVHHMRNWLCKMPTQNDVTCLLESIENLLVLIPEEIEENLGPRVYLKVLIDSVYCLLGLKFCQARQLQNIEWHSDIVRAAYSFLQNYVYLSDSPSAADFKWFISGLIQPHPATFILLMYLSSRTPIDANAQSAKFLLDKALNPLLPTNMYVADLVTSISLKLARSPCTPKISPKSYDCAAPLHRHEVLVLLYGKVKEKLCWNAPTLTAISRSTFPNMGVLPQPDDLAPREKRRNIVSPDNFMDRVDRTKWMGSTDGMSTEIWNIDRKLDDIMKGDHGVWNKWENLIATLFKL